MAGNEAKHSGLKQPFGDLEDVTAADGSHLALVVRAGIFGHGPQFLTPRELTLQLGVLRHDKGSSVARHAHRPIERRIRGTAEVLIVQSGACVLDVFDGEVLVASPELRQGDVVVLIQGGHGLHMLEDTVLIEVKQGPYLGDEEKVRY